jgi:hypothetical protein
VRHSNDAVRSAGDEPVRTDDRIGRRSVPEGSFTPARIEPNGNLERRDCATDRTQWRSVTARGVPEAWPIEPNGNL